MQQTYYRSKVYTSSPSINTLVAAAHPIFSILERLKLSESAIDTALLSINISHELQAFITKIQNVSYNKEVIPLAYFVLRNTIAHELKMLAPKATIALNVETPFEPLTSDTKFLVALEKAMHKPDIYLDFLELTYFSIIAGCHIKNITTFKDNIYEVIQNHKPLAHNKLFISHAPRRRIQTFKMFPWKPIAAFLSGVLLIGFLSMNYALHQKALTLFNNNHALSSNH